MASRKRKFEDNSLLKLVHKVSKSSEEYEFTNHTQWDIMQAKSECIKLFSQWYEDNKKEYKYKHIKHAFNSLCKHYGLVIMKFMSIKVNDENVGELAIFKSFDLKTWIYQNKNNELTLIAFKDSSANIFKIVSKELDSIKPYLIKLCE